MWRTYDSNWYIFGSISEHLYLIKTESQLKILLRAYCWSFDFDYFLLRLNCSNCSFVSSWTPAGATNLCWFLAVIWNRYFVFVTEKILKRMIKQHWLTNWMSFKLAGFLGLDSFWERPNPRPTSNVGRSSRGITVDATGTCLKKTYTMYLWIIYFEVLIN